MPRGFLVKRYSKNASSASAAPTSPCQIPIAISSSASTSSSSALRNRHYSEEDRSDSSSDHDEGGAPFGPRFIQGPTSPALVISPGQSDPGTPSPPLVQFAKDLSHQDEPLALTTSGKNNNSSVTNGRSHLHSHLPLYNPLRSSVLYFPRLDDGRLPGTPPPLRPKPSSLPTATNTAPPVLQHSKAVIHQPPKKRIVEESHHSETKSSTIKVKPCKRPKAVRKLNFDEDKTSPVSGTFIRDLDDEEEMNSPAAVRRGDIDPSLNVVSVTEEARAELAKIENRIGDYVCQLCKEHYADAFGLAQHRCSRIVHVEYRCPECDKVFNCPANLASHRRWHKPRPAPIPKTNGTSPQPRLIPTNALKNNNRGLKLSNKQDRPLEGFNMDLSDSESLRDSPSPGNFHDPANRENVFGSEDFECHFCGKKFLRHSTLRKHVMDHLNPVDSKESEREDFNKRHSFSRLSVSPPPLTIDMDRDEEDDESFKNKSDHEQQISTHKEIEAVACKYCPSVFYNSSGLTRHVNQHHQSENRQILLLQMSTVRPVST